MSSNKTSVHASHLADQAAQLTQQVAHEALAAARDIRHEAAPLLSRATGQASALAQMGMDAVRDGSQQLRDSVRDKAQHASRCTIHYVEDEPVKAVLIAAAAGAALMVGLSLLGRRDR